MSKIETKLLNIIFTKFQVMEFSLHNNFILWSSKITFSLLKLIYSVILIIQLCNIGSLKIIFHYEIAICGPTFNRLLSTNHLY